MENIVIERIKESNIVSKEEAEFIKENINLFTRVYLLGCIDVS